MMTEGIKFLAAYGDENKEVELSPVTGGYWHIYIDRYYYGQVIFTQDKWTAMPQNEGTLEREDLQEIEDRITRYTQNAKKP